MLGVNMYKQTGDIENRDDLGFRCSPTQMHAHIHAEHHTRHVEVNKLLKKKEAGRIPLPSVPVITFSKDICVIAVDHNLAIL